MYSPTLAHLLGGVATPTLVVWGRQDRIVPPICGEQYQRLLPNATLHLLDQCGHLPPLEHPDAFAQLVLDFVDGPRPAAVSRRA